VFAAPGGAASVDAPPCFLTEAGRAFPADKHTMALVVPVVFLVMSVTILFALFPGFVALSQTVP